MAAGSQIPTTWIRNVFPLSDPLTAHIPVQYLTSELFADALTSDEIDDLLDQPFVVDLTKKQRFAIKHRMTLLKKIKRLVSQLDEVSFSIAEGQHIDNVADLRREVLRQIVDHFATDPDTGEKTSAELSNTIQACLVGCTVGALASIRAGAGIEQITLDKQEKPITSAQRMPSNAVAVRVRDQHGKPIAYYASPRAEWVAERIEHHCDHKQAVFAVVQPVSRQRIIDRVEAQPKIEQQATGPIGLAAPCRAKSAPAEKASEISDTTSPKKDGTPSKRRPWREVYAARLMRGLLHHANVAADENEPLDVLADKLRSLIKPVALSNIATEKRDRFGLMLDILGKYGVPVGEEIPLQRLHRQAFDALHHGDLAEFMAALDDDTWAALEAFDNDEPAPATVVISEGIAA